MAIGSPTVACVTSSWMRTTWRAARPSCLTRSDPQGKLHRENVKKPEQCMAVSSHVDGFSVSLALHNTAPNFSLGQKQVAQQQVVKVSDIQEGPLLDWNLGSERPVHVGDRVLEVEGLVGLRAVEALGEARHKLRMTLALEPPEPDELELTRWWRVGGDVPGTRSAEGGSQVCVIQCGQVVLQRGDVKEVITSSGKLVRMRVFSVNQSCEAWVTHTPNFKYYLPAGVPKCLWQWRHPQQTHTVRIRQQALHSSPQIGALTGKHVVVEQVEGHARIGDLIRIPIRFSDQAGWVTLEHRTEGPFFNLLAPPARGIWRAREDAMVRKEVRLQSPRVRPIVKEGDIVWQCQPWQSLPDGQIRLCIQREAGTGWVTLCTLGASDKAPSFELIGVVPINQ